MKTRICVVICVIYLLLGSVFALASCNSDDPVGIVSANINEDGELVLVYSDGNEQNLGIVVGKDGENGKDGKDGKDGADGATFIPSINANGDVSWTNNKGLTNPPTVNVRGPQGEPGKDAPTTLASSSTDGLMSKSNFVKLSGIEDGSQKNKIEVVSINGTAQAITNKVVNIDLSNYAVNPEDLVKALENAITQLGGTLPQK